MPKENTHLYFAHQVAEVIPDEALANLIRREMGVFYFGSVVPDTFYYSKKSEVIKISEYLHGKDGNLTNEFIFELLKKAKESRNQADLVFALGFITHCVLDIVFHPVIYYLSGNYYDPNREAADRAIYLHRHLETALDARVNQSFYFDKLIRLSFLDKLSFDEVLIKKFGISRAEFLLTLRHKALLLKALHYDWLYYVLVALRRLGLVRRPVLVGIFYRNLKHEQHSLPDFIAYRHPVSGEAKQVTIQELFYKARHLAVDRLTAAYAYYLGEIKKEEALEIIHGESLSAGLEGAAVGTMRYFYNNE
jgi:hypothetical protein